MKSSDEGLRHEMVEVLGLDLDFSHHITNNVTQWLI